MPNWNHISAVPCRKSHSELPFLLVEALTAVLLSDYSTPPAILVPLSTSRYGSKYVFLFLHPLNVNLEILSCIFLNYNEIGIRCFGDFL
jgi:hypothetical protein